MTACKVHVLKRGIVNWNVYFTNKAKKQFDALPVSIQYAVQALVQEIGILGPLRHNWKNFGKLSGTSACYHCHLKKGKPTYVICWEVIDKKIKIVEVSYVGTHENAPY
jgi:mRNA-degrading endonuclease RelE of RelBE toxin-antitoxin system